MPTFIAADDHNETPRIGEPCLWQQA